MFKNTNYYKHIEKKVYVGPSKISLSKPHPFHTIVRVSHPGQRSQFKHGFVKKA